MGMFGRRVEQPGDPNAALIEAFAHGGPAHALGSQTIFWRQLRRGRSHFDYRRESSFDTDLRRNARCSRDSELSGSDLGEAVAASRQRSNRSCSRRASHSLPSARCAATTSRWADSLAPSMASAARANWMAVVGLPAASDWRACVSSAESRSRRIRSRSTISQSSYQSGRRSVSRFWNGAGRPRYRPSR